MSSWFGQSHAAKPHAVQSEQEAFWYLNLTQEQNAAHDAFLEHLKETGALLPGHDDRFTLLRFLKARQWDVHRATIMYTKMTAWRKEHGVDKLAESFEFTELDRVAPHYPHFYHKTDRFGRPVYIELSGRTDAAKILEGTTLERLLDYHVWEWEKLTRQILPACTLIAGRPIITRNVILDLNGLSMKNFGTAAQKLLRTVAAIDQDYYCELLGQMFIINTPAIFRLVWAIVNPLLEERTRRKIVILGHDFLPTVTQLIPEENLPKCLGGKSDMPDLRTSMGPWKDVELPPCEGPSSPSAVMTAALASLKLADAAALHAPLVPLPPHAEHHEIRADVALAASAPPVAAAT
ncbi:hypothetical protein HYH03_012481 [Edaphochlamys debaryana]|uniref:CRAL-TRIO domain-containing protein n=1 Tax=Edaphochlamys debaryana TaxID=47281 RepID=A0A835XSP7_9CHLO|nr:hypothetical protein HYH03_012481 [Edaphochlamys debaryana]|eukprot:KAG2489044.1 hypothetical protein HYH03_012481 [Edaphochlamys debaryana]